MTPIGNPAVEIRRSALAALVVAALAAAVLASLTALDDRAAVPSGEVSTKARLVWFYKPPPPAHLRPVMSRFDTYIFNRGDEQFRDDVLAKRPQARVYQYVLLNQVLTEDLQGRTWRNNVAWEPGDVDRLMEEHPDWFLRDTRGRLIVGGGRFYTMDPGNPGWQQFWIDRVLSRAVGWSGLFVDNLDVSLCGLERTGQKPALYPTDAQYTAALADFLRAASRAYGARTGRPVLANLVNECEGRSNREAYLPHLQGYMEEAAFSGYSSHPLSPERWEAQLTQMEDALTAGKQVLAVAQGAVDDHQRAGFSYASYLLVWDPELRFRYAQSRDDGYRELWYLPHYDMDLGSPRGPRRRLPDGAWRRDFTHGWVQVDAEDSTYRIERT